MVKLKNNHKPINTAVKDDIINNLTVDDFYEKCHSGAYGLIDPTDINSCKPAIKEPKKPETEEPTEEPAEDNNRCVNFDDPDE